MAVNESWPHVTELLENESKQHRRLKNYAARWLIERGFDPGEIEVEKHLSPDGSTRPFCRADLFAKSGALSVIVEAETQFSNPQGSVRTTLRVAEECGHDVFVIESEGIHRIDHELKTATGPRGNNPIQREWPVAIPVSGLPLVDLSAFGTKND